MRYPASEKLEIIRIVEQSHLPAKQTLDRLGIARPTFYRWYDLYLRFGEDALADRRYLTLLTWRYVGPARPIPSLRTRRIVCKKELWVP